MKKFMKLAVVGMCLSLAITGLVANGQGEEEVAETEKPVRIWYHSGLEPSLHKTLFSHSDIQTEQTVSPPKDYMTKLDLAIATNDEPDIMFMLVQDVPKYVEKGILAPVDGAFEGDTFELYTEGWRRMVTYGDNVYMVPYVNSATAIFYNRDILKEAGLEEPKDNWSLDQFMEYLEILTLKNAAGETIRYAIQLTPDSPIESRPSLTRILLTWLWNFGAKPVSNDGKTAQGYINSKEAVEAMVFVQNIYKKGYAPKENIPNGFENGRVAMHATGNWMIGFWNTNFPNIDIGVVSHPKYKENADTVMAWGWSLSSRSKNKENAIQVLRSITEPETLVDFSEKSSMLIPREDVVDLLDLDPLTKKIAQYASYSKPYPPVVESTEFNDILNEAFAKIIFGANVKSTLDNVAVKLDAILK